MKLLDIIFGIICIPIGMILFLCVATFATVLWLPYFVWKIIDKMFKPSINDDFIEFIFVCYGLAIVCLTAPFLELFNLDV